MADCWTDRVHGIKSIMDYMSQRITPKFVPKVYVLPTVTLRLRFGQHHKFLFDKYKPFIHNHLQTRLTD